MRGGWRLRAITAFVTGMMATGGTLQAAPARAPGGCDEAAAILAAAAPSPSGLDEAAIRRLVEIGPTAIGPVFDAFRSRGSSDGFGATCLAALSRFPANHMESFLEASVRRGVSPGEGMAAIEVLAEFPGATAGRAALAMLRGIKRAHLASPAIREGLASRTGILLLRNAEAREQFRAAFPDLPDPLKGLVIRAAEAGGLEPLLLGLLGPGSKRHEAEILGALGRIPTICPEQQSKYCPRIRRYLRGGDPSVRAAAIRAVGRMRDAESTPDLLAVLSDCEDADVREAAAAALRRISGLRMQSDASLWARWEKGEADWLATRFPVLERILGEEKAEPVQNALAEIGAHPRHQEKLRRLVLRHLGSACAGVRRAACEALRSLGSAEALPALLRATEDPDPDVSVAADRALRHLTDIDPPPGRNWKSVLAPR